MDRASQLEVEAVVVDGVDGGGRGSVVAAELLLFYNK